MKYHFTEPNHYCNVADECASLPRRLPYTVTATASIMEAGFSAGGLEHA
jgi:hypothetical protein